MPFLFARGTKSWLTLFLQLLENLSSGVNAFYSMFICTTKEWNWEMFEAKAVLGSARRGSPNGSTYLLEADWATVSTYLWAYISCVHCTFCMSVLSCHPKTNKLLETSLSPFTLPTKLYSKHLEINIAWRARGPVFYDSPNHRFFLSLIIRLQWKKLKTCSVFKLFFARFVSFCNKFCSWEY